MIVDARTLPDRHLIDVDLCIVGSGPAGLTVARELRDSSLSICIVESGTERPEQAYEQLNDSIAVDSDLTPPRDGRARAVGGTSHRWNLYSGGLGGRVRLLPFSPIDFEERSWVPDSGWPITSEQLEPFQRRARSIAGLTADAQDADAASTPSRPILPLDRERIRTAIEWFGKPARFQRQTPRELAQRPNLTLLTHATATSIASDSTATAVSGLELRTLTGGQLSVRARRIVLATGGIENARLLLASRDRHPDGLGNDRDLVGRYFMDHLKLMVADFAPASSSLINRMGFYDIHRVGETVLTGKLQLTDQVQRQAQLLNAAVRFEPRSPTRPRPLRSRGGAPCPR